MFFTCHDTEKIFYLLTIYNTNPEKPSKYIFKYDLYNNVVTFVLSLIECLEHRRLTLPLINDKP